MYAFFILAAIMYLEFVCIFAYIHSLPHFIPESYSVVHSFIHQSVGLVGFMACYDDQLSMIKPRK